MSIVSQGSRVPRSRSTLKQIRKVEGGHQSQLEEPPQNPNGTVMIEIVPRGQLSPPRIVHDYRRTELGSLHNCLNFTTIPHALASTLCEKKINSTFLTPIRR
jgi:hypothetical protein